MDLLCICGRESPHAGRSLPFGSTSTSYWVPPADPRVIGIRPRLPFNATRPRTRDDSTDSIEATPPFVPLAIDDRRLAPRRAILGPQAGAGSSGPPRRRSIHHLVTSPDICGPVAPTAVASAPH